MTTTTSLAVLLTLEDKLTSQLSKVNNQVEKTFDKSLKAVSKTLTTIGNVATGVSLIGLNTAISFDDSMRQVASVVGLPMEAMGELAAKAEEMGKTTKFHATEAAEAMYYMGLAGWNDQEIMDGLNGVMMLSAASGVDLACTSDIVTDALTAFGLQASDANHFVDVLAQTSRSSNTNVDLLGQSFKYVAPLAGEFGMSVEDVGVALGLMANQGIKADTAGVALRNLLNNTIKPTKTMAIAMNELGLEIEDEEGHVRPLIDIIRQLRTGTQGMTEAQKAATISNLAGKEALSGVLALVNTSDEDFANLTEQIYNSSGAAQEMSDVMEGGLGGSWREVQSLLENMSIQIGNALVPSVADLLQDVKPLIDSISSFVQDNPDLVAKVIEMGIALGGVGRGIQIITGGTKTVGDIAGGVKLASDALSSLDLASKAAAAAQWLLNSAFLACPITWIVIGIAALVAVFVLLWNNCEPFRQFWIDLWDKIKEAAGKAWEWLQTLPEKISTMWNSIKTWASELPGKIAEWFANLWDSIAQWFDIMWTGLTQWLANLPYEIGYWLGNVLAAIINWGADLWNRLVTWIGNTWDYLTTKVPELINNIVTFFSELPGKIWEWLVNAYQKTVEWLTNMWTSMTTRIKETIDAVVKFFSELPGKVWTWLLDVIDKTVRWLEDMYVKAKEGIKNVADTVVNTVKELPGKMLQIGKDIVTGLWDGISSMIGWIGDKVKGFVSGVVDGFKDGFDIHSPSKVFAEMGRFNIAGLEEGMQAAIKALDLPTMVATITTDFGQALAPIQIDTSTMYGGRYSNNDGYSDSHNTNVTFTGDIVMDNALDVEAVAQYIGATVANAVY